MIQSKDSRILGMLAQYQFEGSILCMVPYLEYLNPIFHVDADPSTLFK